LSRKIFPKINFFVFLSEFRYGPVKSLVWKLIELFKSFWFQTTQSVVGGCLKSFHSFSKQYSNMKLKSC